VEVVAQRTVDRPDTTAPTRNQRLVMLAALGVGFVLRWWDLGGPGASFDESFTGTYSHLPLGRIPAALRANDAHPPLDYLLRHFSGPLGNIFALRAPSAVFGCLTLLVVAWWMWRRGWFGVAVVVLTSLSSFQLLYAHQARMYALAILCGTIAAAAAERWLREPLPRWRWMMGLALLVGLFDHSPVLLLAGGLVLVAGRRRDAEAWWWRATVAGALVVWGAVWGTSFVVQMRGAHSTWIPFTSVTSVRDAISGLTVLYTQIEVMAVCTVAVGVLVLLTQDRPLGRVTACLFVAPFAVACLVGLRSHFLLARTMAFAAWVVPLSLAALVEWARRRSGVMAAAMIALVVVLVVPSVKPAVTYQEDAAPAVRALGQDLQPGDAAAVYPSWLGPLAIWGLDAPRQPLVPAALAGRGAFVFVRGGGAFDGRVWVLQPYPYAISTAGWVSCGGPTARIGDYRLSCWHAGPGSDR
jgi:hypothetical protein